QEAAAGIHRNVFILIHVPAPFIQINSLWHFCLQKRRGVCSPPFWFLQMCVIFPPPPGAPSPPRWPSPGPQAGSRPASRF
ncbi:DUF6133 domain-containing protein, partial [Dysosmobacter welbionis]